MNIRHTVKLAVSLAAIPAIATSENRPNILWLTIEDTSDYEFGCYGAREAQTPVIDSLAGQGIQYMNAWSVAPQSSPARSSIITGAYATTYAMDLHRNKQKTPSQIYFPQLLREAGYFCTNNKKTDYNSGTPHYVCWDECSDSASYNSENRKKNQPFFSVFNCLASHMGRIRSFHLDGRRDYRKEGINPDQLILPPHLPDLHEVRMDYAGHLEGVQDIDKWIGWFLDDLKKKNLEDNTIVFFYSDHGGCSPRGKGYIYETGLRVPMIVYLPKKWEHLSSEGTKIKNTRLVSFNDLGATVLSLAGIKPSEKFQGDAFLGKHETAKKKYQFAFTSNQHSSFSPARAVTDGRYKYIRNYIPYRYFSLRNYYQWGMPSNMAWDNLVISGKTKNSIYNQPFDHKAGEMLFDLESDKWELINLADKPEMKNKLQELRDALSEHIRTTKDLGFFIPSSRSETTNLYELARSEDYPLSELYTLVEKASCAKPEDLDYFRNLLSHRTNEIRFWASVGIAELATQGYLKKSFPELSQLLNDQDDYIASEAAYALTFTEKKKEAFARLVTPADEKYRKAGYTILEITARQKEHKKEMKTLLPVLWESAKNFNIKDNEDAGLIARGILVNMGEMNIKDMYGKESYNIGLKINKGRRALVPLPE
ncbi:MAG: sulfatase-like hydrolase/transferase [Bacteroidales bacterium]